MRLNRPVCSVLVVSAVSVFWNEARANQPPVHPVYGKLPLSFEFNRGQTDHRVKFLSRGSGYTLFLTSTEAVLSLRSARALDESAPGPRRQSDVLRIKLIAANPAARVSGIDELPGKSNYFIGDDPKKWQTNVSTFLKVKYQNVYPGIDLIYYGNEGQLEHDFILAPGANPRKIRLGLRGGTKARIDSEGNLLLTTVGGTISLHKLRAYQNGDGEMLPIMARYVLKGGNQIGFEVAKYDVNKRLVIDPVLSYSTYLGGNSDDFGNAIAVDSVGNAYVTGETLSSNFPTVGALPPPPGGYGSGDAFVIKVNAAGTALVYSTYLGGSGEDSGNSIAVDSAGNAYVTGQTASPNFPTKGAPPQGSSFGGGANDAFVAKLNPTGNDLVYSTYLGRAGDDIGSSIAVDSAGNAYVTGQTDDPTNFPTTAGAFQRPPFQKLQCGTPPNASYCSSAFVSKLNSTGNAWTYSTYLAGNHVDIGYGIAVDSAGNAYVTGSTDSGNFPTANAFQGSQAGGGDAFVVKLNAAGAGLVYATYLGGATVDNGFSIAVDSAGSAYVTGVTDSGNFPTKNPFQATPAPGPVHAFVTKFDPAGALAYSTYLGGSKADRGFGIAVDSVGNAYVTGRTDSTDFPTERPIQAASSGGPGDAFVAKLNPAGNAIVFSTYLGGNRRSRGFGIALDSRTPPSAYVTGITDSTDFRTTSGAFQTAPTGMFDVIVSKIDDSAPDFGVALASGSSGSASVNCGQTASYNLQLVPLNDFTGSVSLSCEVVAPPPSSAQGLTCRPSANSVSIAGATVPFSVSVVSTGRSVVPPTTTGFGDERKRFPSAFWGMVILSLLTILAFLPRSVRHLKAVTNVWAFIGLILLTAYVMACLPGGAGHAFPGQYTVTVSGTSQPLTRTVSLKLAVDCPK